MEPPAEPSRSFKRRQRRKKQLERRRQANGRRAGSSDEHEPSGAVAGEPHSGADRARPAAAAVTEAERRQPGPVTSCEASPAARAASAASSLGSGKGRPRRSSRPEREEGRTDEVSPGSAAQEGAESGPGEPAGPQDTPPAEENPNSAEPAGRPKSGSAKRRKRKSTGPSGAVPESQPTEPDPSPGQPAGPDPSRSPAAAERVSPAGPEPARRRETSPVVSSSEEVLRSIRTLQTVLGELRTGLLAAPPPAAAPKAPAQVPGGVAAAGRSPTQAAPAPEPESAPAPSPAAVAAAAAAAAATTTMPPPATAEPPTGGEAPQKTKEQIKAERRAKAEAAKLAKAAKASQKKQQTAAAAADGASGDKAPVKAGQADGAAGEVSGKPAGKAPDRVAPAQPAGKPATDDAAGRAPEKPAGEKSKAELKAERRAKQEAQRAAKAAAAATAPAAKSGTAAAASKAAAPAKSGKGPAENGQSTPAAGRNQETESRADRRSAKKMTEKASTKKGLQMFSHLPQFDASSTGDLIVQHRVHPALVPLLLRLSAGGLSGANAGAVALLAALADLVDQYSTPAQRELRRDLPHQVRRAVEQVAQCRPISVAMENVTHQLEQAIPTRVPADMADNEAKEVVIKWIEDFIRDDICKAMSGIKGFAGEKIKDGDVILTYGRSTAVMEVLLSAHQNGRQFRVLVVDSRPRLDGRDTLRQLLDAGVPCSYGVITAISHHMKEATKVLLGAQALLSNGMVLSQAGTALVCLTGRALNRPVLICCETYKFSDRVQIDSQVYNHLGDPDELVCSADSPLANWRRSESLSLLNLMYDVTPPELVDAVITELGAIPCSSVPAVLRLQQTVV